MKGFNEGGKPTKEEGEKIVKTTAIYNLLTKKNKNRMKGLGLVRKNERDRVKVSHIGVLEANHIRKNWIRAYKGVNSDGTPGSGYRTFRYEEGCVYEKENDDSARVRVCSDTMLHACKSIRSVFQYYENRSHHRFYRVYVCPEGMKEDKLGDKIGCLKMFVDKDVTEVCRFIERRELDEKIAGRMGLYSVERLLDMGINLIVRGSLSLFLQGIILERFVNSDDNDIDITLPYWQNMGTIRLHRGDKGFRYPKSDNNTFYRDHEKRILDVIVDPSQQYEEVHRFGRKFKVAPVLDTMRVKLNYGRQKDLWDVSEIIDWKNRHIFDENSHNLPF